MRVGFYVMKRYVYTYFAKFFTDIATLTHWEWTVPVIDFFIVERGKVLSYEAVACMNKTKKWQRKAERCVAAYHEFEMYMKDKSKK